MVYPSKAKRHSVRQEACFRKKVEKPKGFEGPGVNSRRKLEPALIAGRETLKVPYNLILDWELVIQKHDSA